MRVDDLERRLKAHVMGQDEAVKQVSQALRRAHTGPRNPTRPLASFLFDGASGVGKTKFAQAIAIEFYGSKESLVHVDMGGHMGKHFLSLFTESADQGPRKVILFCEIEKASPAIAKSLLQIIDDGVSPEQHVWATSYCTRPTRQKVNFRDAVIIMTSNVGQPHRSHCLADSDLRQRISQSLTGIFRAQLLYRIDEIVLFKELTKEDLMMIVDVMAGEMVKKMKMEKGIEVVVSNELKNQVISVGYSWCYGAKQLKWAFARLVEAQLADGFLKGSLKSGSSITVNFDPSYESMFTFPASS